MSTSAKAKSTKTTQKQTKSSDKTQKEDTSAETEGQSNAIICIDPIDFDADKLVVHSPVQNEFILKSGAPIKTTTSSIKYLDDSGRECDFYVRGDTQHTFGFSYNHEMTVAKDDRTSDNATGLQVCYPLTSLATTAAPKDTEQALMDVFTGVWQAVVDKGKTECKNKTSKMPSVSKSSFIAAAESEDWAEAVKFPFAHPKDKQDKTKSDESKPASIYTKLVTSGRGKTMKVSTVIRGPGDKVRNALHYVDTPGLLTPVFHIECAYHGAHGSEAPYGTSLRIKLAQANFVPKAFSRVPQNRMLPRNTAPVEEDGGDDVFPPARSHDDVSGEEDEGFSAPGEDAVNPSATLSKSTKAVPKAKTVLAKTVPAKAKAVPAKVAGKAKAVPKATKTVSKPKVVEPDPEEEVDEDNEEVDVSEEEVVDDEE